MGKGMGEISKLKKFILHEGKGVSMSDGAIELPDWAVIEIIEFYEERFKSAGAVQTRPSKVPNKHKEEVSDE